MKILICLPAYSTVHEDTVKGIEECLHYHQNDDTLDFDVSMSQAADLTSVRNFLLNEEMSFKEHQDPIPGYDYFLLVDSDIGFHVTDVLRLLRVDVPICCGAVPDRLFPEKIIAGHFKKMPDGTKIPGITGDSLTKKTKGIFFADWAGACFMLIHRAALRQIPYPWFHQGILEYGEDRFVAAEDMGFAVQCKKGKIPIVVDTEMTLKHHGRGDSGYIPFEEVFKRFRDIKAAKSLAKVPTEDIDESDMGFSVG